MRVRIDILGHWINVAGEPNGSAKRSAGTLSC
jgi:hypothetical protein